jgi:tRNA(Leu) C34 or U34 (ribose-2'-O)-methylase TrmL
VVQYQLEPSVDIVEAPFGTWRRGPEFGDLAWGKGQGKAPALILIDPKYPHNVGQIVRLASCYGFQQIWTTGHRVAITSNDKDYRLPREERMRGYSDVLLANTARPFDQFKKTTFVAVEFRPNSEDLTHFEHPSGDVAYVFGPEDGEIPSSVLGLCHRFVKIPTAHCLNLGTAVATVLWDRRLKTSK